MSAEKQIEGQRVERYATKTRTNYSFEKTQGRDKPGEKKHGENQSNGSY